MYKRLALLLASTLGAATIVAGASASTHLSGDFVIPQSFCGVDVQDEVQYVDNYGTKADGTSSDSGYIHETLTAANGRAVEIKYGAGHEENAAPVTNPDGTTTFVATYSGLNAKTQIVGGPVLEQGSGRIQWTLVLDADGNTVSSSIVSLSGQNPNLTGEPDCSVVGPYLAGA
jgi:hypothetical protein